MELPKPKLLLLLKLPPPYTGATMMNERIFNSKKIRSGFQCTFITASYRNNIDRNSFFPIRKLLIFLRVFYQLLNYIIQQRPNIMYFQFSPLNGPFYRDAILGFVAIIFKVPVVYHIRVYGVKMNSRRSINKWLYKKLFSDNYIICHSERMHYDFADVYQKTPLVLTNGLEDLFANSTVSKVSNTFESNFLFISNYLASKGIPTLIEAAKILKSKEFQFKLFLIGDNTHDYTREKLIGIVNDFKLEDHVVILGPVYGDPKLEYLRQSDVFLFPTEYEAFGNVAIEAMQASLPVIATNEGSLPLMIDDGVNGFLIPKKDPVALAEKMEFLCLNPALRIKMGLAGRKKYLKNFTLEQFENNFVKTMTSISNELAE